MKKTRTANPWTIAALMLCILCLFPLLSMAESEDGTENGYNYTVEYGCATVTGYCGTDTALVIPDTLGGYPVTAIGKSAFISCSDLTSIILPSSVSSIGSCAFWNCTSLTKFDIPFGVTEIRDYTFNECISLTSITIPDSVTSIDLMAFGNCESLDSIVMPESLTYLDPGAIDYHFPALYASRNSVAALTISKAEYSFRDPDIPHLAFRVSGTKDGRRTYRVTNCDENVTEIIIPDFVDSIDHYAFSNCPSLRSIYIPNSVTSIGSNAFWNCSSLSSIVIPDSVTEIGIEAFDDCPAVIYANRNSSAALALGNVYYFFCDPSVPLFSFCVIEEADGTRVCYANNNNPSAIDVIIPDYVNIIGFRAFKNCTSLASVVLPDSVTTIESEAFADCSALSRITIPASVTNISEYAFENSSGLTIFAPEGSAAQAYAAAHGIAFEAM